MSKDTLVMMLEEGSRKEFKHNVFAYMVDTSEWEIERNLLEALNAHGLFGSSLGYEAREGWLYLTFILTTAANSKAMVLERLRRVAPLADCYVDTYDFVEHGRIRYKGWARFKHVLSVHVKVMQERSGFVASNEVKTFLKRIGDRAFAVDDT